MTHFDWKTKITLLLAMCVKEINLFTEKRRRKETFYFELKLCNLSEYKKLFFDAKANENEDIGDPVK